MICYMLGIKSQKSRILIDWIQFYNWLQLQFEKSLMSALKKVFKFYWKIFMSYPRIYWHPVGVRARA